MRSYEIKSIIPFKACFVSSTLFNEHNLTINLEKYSAIIYSLSPCFLETETFPYLSLSLVLRFPSLQDPNSQIPSTYPTYFLNNSLVFCNGKSKPISVASFRFLNSNTLKKNLIINFETTCFNLFLILNSTSIYF